MRKGDRSELFCCEQHRMGQLGSGIGKGCTDVCRLQIRVIGQDCLFRCTTGEQLEDISHADAHAADAGSSVALGGIDGDAVEKGHGLKVRPGEVKVKAGGGGG